MATIQTGGYAQPSLVVSGGLVDPRLLASDYGQLTQGIGQGLSLVNNFANQRQLALERADQNSLRDLRLAAQRGQLELEPQLQQDRAAVSRRAALEARLKPIELETSNAIARGTAYGAPTSSFTTASTPEELEAGILGTFEMKQNKIPGDVTVNQTRRVVDPVTGIESTVNSIGQVLQTAEQIANVEADNKARQDAIAAQTAIAKAERERREAAQKVADQIAKDKLKVEQDREKRLANAPSGFVTKDGQFDRRASQNAADVNRYLMFPGGLPDVAAFSATPDGRKIVLKIQTALTRQEPPRFSDQEEVIINDFYNGNVANQAPAPGALPDIPAPVSGAVTNMATQPPAAGSLPTAAAATLPQGSSVRQATEAPQNPAPITPITSVRAGTIVRQNGVSYQFDGTNYIPLQ